MVHTFKVTAILLWIAATGLAAAGWIGWTRGWSTSRWELRLPNGHVRDITATDSGEFAAQRDGAIVQVRDARVLAADKVLTIALTWISYDVDTPPGFAEFDLDQHVSARRNPFLGNGYEEMRRSLERFPLTEMSWPVAHTSHRAQYSFVRANGICRHGFDLEVRVPFVYIVAILILPAFLMVARRAASLLTRASEEGSGNCRCGYDLRASPDRCPECGRPTPIAARNGVPPTK
jgi:hypothetical protein